MAKQYVSPADAAKLYNCSPPAILKQMKAPRGKLCAAVVIVDGKKRIDLKHAAAKEYRKEHRRSQKEVDSGTVETTGGVGVELESEIRTYLDYTVRDVVDRYGTMELFASLLAAAYKIEQIHAQRLASDRSTGKLISREFVKKHVLGLVERSNQRLLTDMPTKLASEVHTMCDTDATVEEVQQVIQDAVSRELKTVKGDVAKEIKRATD